MVLQTDNIRTSARCSRIAPQQVGTFAAIATTKPFCTVTLSIKLKEKAINQHVRKMWRNLQKCEGICTKMWWNRHKYVKESSQKNLWSDLHKNVKGPTQKCEGIIKNVKELAQKCEGTCTKMGKNVDQNAKEPAQKCDGICKPTANRWKK